MKIGVFGGTFDPVHLGHIRMAEEVRDTLGLSQVLLIPAGIPVTRSQLKLTPAEHRLEMIRLAVADKPRLVVSAMEIERPGPSYTVDTLVELRRRHKEDELYLLLGWDSLLQIKQWRDPARIIEICYLVSIPRPGYPRPDMENLGDDIPGISKKVIILEKPRTDVSASDIRERVIHGKPIDHLVPEPVAEYITKHKLYRKAGGVD